MAGYLLLAGFAVVAIAVFVHVRRTPKMPVDRDPSKFSVRDPGAGRGGDGMI